MMSTVQATDLGVKWSEIRIFGTNNKFASEPTDLNNLTAADGVPAFKSMTGIGIEADGQVLPWLKIGTRIKGILTSSNRQDGPMPANSYLTFQQYSGGILTRIPLINRDFVLLDAVAELGVSNNKIDIQTTGGKGTFTKDGNFYQRAGGSLGIGWSSFKFYVEAGYEWNKLSGMSFEGTLTNNISSVDLSGPYTSIGIIISGVPSWIKPGSISVGK